MASFRSARSQAIFALRPKLAIGVGRHSAKAAGSVDAYVHSFGTARNYTQALTQCAEWYGAQARAGRPGFREQVRQITAEQAQEYLLHRANSIGQKQLDLDRQALEKLLGLRLGRTKSQAEQQDRLATQPRAYSQEQIEQIACHQTPENALATLIAASAGLRGHELFALATPDEQTPSVHRPFRADRFAGYPDYSCYTVIGKGGLVREVALTRKLALRLDEVRLPEPRGVRDRGIWYHQKFRIGGGQRWSQSFTDACSRALGWSTGAHGLRHHYAQRRLEELQQRGFAWDDALEIVSQELGHFRRDVTLTYLR